MGQEVTRQSRGDEDAGGDVAREYGERAARAPRVVIGRGDARMGGEDAGSSIPSRPDRGSLRGRSGIPSSPVAPTDTLCVEARRICAMYGAGQPVRGPSSCNRDPPFARPSARRMYCAELHRWISATNPSGSMPSPDTGGEAERFFSCGGGSGRYTVMVNAKG